jgi:GNAT superfamily N-acetyltransferase
VVAYFSLCPHEIQRQSLPKKHARSGPVSIPAILSAKLAVNEQLSGQGYGGQLLGDALSRAVAAVEMAGGRFIVVDAIDEAARGFYELYGFEPVPGLVLRLVMRSSSARKSLSNT